MPADTKTTCDAIPIAPTITATDNCSTAIEVIANETRTEGDCPNSFTLSRVWTATDECGNEVSFTQTIGVADNEAPILSALPSDLTVDGKQGELVPEVAVVTATDNCTTDIQVIFDEQSRQEGCGSVITREWTATDECGNTISGRQIITVIDGFSPVIEPEVISICAGAEMEISVLPNDDIYEYSWTSEGGQFSTTTDAVTVFSADELGQYVVTAVVTNRTRIVIYGLDQMDLLLLNRILN